MKKFKVGDHVVYAGKSYAFPGEITMADETSYVVKAFGDAEGNYTGMKHLYGEGQLDLYTLGEFAGIPPLVIFPNDNPISKIRGWLERYGDRPGKSRLAVNVLTKMVLELEELAAEWRAERQQEEKDGLAWEEREALKWAKVEPLPMYCPHTGKPCLSDCDGDECVLTDNG